MTTVPKWDLKQGTWEDARSWIGRELAVTHGADEVTRSDVRRKLEVMGFDSPLNTDDEVAGAFGYPQAPALTAMLMTWSMPAYWKPGDPQPREGDPVLLPPFPLVTIPAPGDSVFATNVDTEFLEPVYPGDRITATARLVDVTRKRTQVGDGAFMTVETTYTNQKEDVVGIDRLTVFRYSAETGKEASES